MVVLVDPLPGSVAMVYSQLDPTLYCTEYPVMVDPVGGVGGVQDTLIFPGSDWGVAVTVGGGGASVELVHMQGYYVIMMLGIADENVPPPFTKTVENSLSLDLLCCFEYGVMGRLFSELIEGTIKDVILFPLPFDTAFCNFSPDSCPGTEVI